MKKFASVRDLVMSLEADFEKFYDKGNQAAGTRVRQGMQQMKVLAQDIRKEVQDTKNKAAATKPKTAGAAKKPAVAKKAAPAAKAKKK
jgi:hypothetical protein